MRDSTRGTLEALPIPISIVLGGIIVGIIGGVLFGPGGAIMGALAGMIAGGMGLPAYAIIKCCLHFNPACKPEAENNINENTKPTENKKTINQEKTKLITANNENPETYSKVLTSSYGKSNKDSSFSPSQDAYETLGIGL